MIKHVIIGNSAAGIGAVEAIRQQDPGCSITMVSDEVHPFYSRCQLPDYIAGALTIDKLLMRRLDFYHRNRLTLLAGEKAEQVDAEKKEVILASGKGIPYDRLLVATGAGTFFPPVPGIDLPGVVGLRTLADGEQIMALSSTAREAVVIGAGLVGLEVAGALAARGIKVTVVEKLPRVLPVQLDETAAHLVSQDFVNRGISLVTGVGFTKISKSTQFQAETGAAGDTRLAVSLENGETLPADLVVVAAGTRPNVGLVMSTGVTVGKGIVVNERQETTIPGIYAAGDVAETVDVVTGQPGLSPIWPNAVKQGKMAGLNMAGLNRAGEPLIAMQNSMTVGGMDVISLGLVNPLEESHYRILVRQKGGNYKKLVFKERVLVGAVLVGEVEPAGVYAALIKSKKEVTISPAILMDGNFGYSRLLRVFPGKVS